MNKQTFNVNDLLANNGEFTAQFEQEQKTDALAEQQSSAEPKPFDAQKYFDCAMQLPHQQCAIAVLEYDWTKHYFASTRIEIINDSSVRLIAHINAGIKHIYPSNAIDITLKFDYDDFLEWYYTDPAEAHKLQPWTKDLVL